MEHIPQDLRGTTERLLRSRGVAYAALFGSRAKGLATEGSDYDFLIQFAPNARGTLFALGGIKNDLEEALGKPVDVVTVGGLYAGMQKEVYGTAKVLFDER